MFVRDNLMRKINVNMLMKNKFDLCSSACLDIRHLILISNERWTLIFEKVITAPAQIPQMHFDFVFVFSILFLFFP